MLYLQLLNIYHLLRILVVGLSSSSSLRSIHITRCIIPYYSFNSLFLAFSSSFYRMTITSTTSTISHTPQSPTEIPHNYTLHHLDGTPHQQYLFHKGFKQHYPGFHQNQHCYFRLSIPLGIEIPMVVKKRINVRRLEGGLQKSLNYETSYVSLPQ